MRSVDLQTNRRRFEELLVARANRRRLLLGGATVVAVSLPGLSTRIIAQDAMGTPVPDLTAPAYGATPSASARFASTPFTLGVASGDPLPDGVVLWTRLAPTPRDGGGMDNIPYEVRWELASDESFASLVQSGTTIASPQLAHSVHVDVTGLQPATEYYYRFMVGGEESPVGRTRTAPAAGAAVDSVRFAFTSCAHYEHGYFAAYRHLAEQRFDLVFNLGDYIYEMGPGDYSVYEGEAPRNFSGAELLDLSLFRNRHALYKTDPDLQAAHASAPWVVTWDDHEVENDYANLTREDPRQQVGFEDLRAAGYQAYYEHMPLRASSMPTGPDMQLYRRIRWGNLAEFQVLDGRQYRSDQPCGEGTYVRCPASVDPNTTMLGPDQERWLLGNLDASTSTWNVLAQQTQMAMLEQGDGDQEQFFQDSWPGYPEARNRILGHVMSRGIQNLTVLTGDIHCHWGIDLLADWRDANSQVLGTEFICSSITAGGAEDPAIFFEEFLGEGRNPSIRFFDPRHSGYSSVEATPERWTTDYWQVEDMRQQDSPVNLINTLITEAGNPGVQQG
ncbi:MAG TPA: alkaline phosphatase D family protein [Thermomicrobiales bacterium]|jgi:alkaline phosphatase D|nr:alkaline phosphatase D family protein [Thermomicrobiales bacterium]